VKVDHRVPTGCLDRVLGVRVDTSSAVPELVITTWRRSPADVGEDAFIETAEAVRCQIQFSGLLLEQIRHAVEQALTRQAAA
jgi:hypothetical protein